VADKDFQIKITSTADTSGAQAATTSIQDTAKAVADLKQQLEDAARANGATEEQVKSLSSAFSQQSEKLQELFATAKSADELQEGIKQVAKQTEDLAARLKEADQIKNDFTNGEAAQQWSQVNKGAFVEAERDAEGFGNELDHLTHKFAKVRTEAGAVHKTFGLLEGAMMGTGWGILIAALGELTLHFIETGKEAQKLELEKRAEEAKDFAKGLAELGKSAAEAFSDETLAKIKKYLEELHKLSHEWEASRDAAKEYWSFVESKIEAQKQLDLAKVEFERQNELKGVTDEKQKRDINERYDQRKRDIDFKAADSTIAAKKQESADNLRRAEEATHDIQNRITSLNQDLAATKAKSQITPDTEIAPGQTLSSDQEGQMKRYREALNRMQIGRGTEDDQKTIRDISPHLPELRRRLSEGDVTYEDAKKSSNQREVIAAQQAEAQRDDARKEMQRLTQERQSQEGELRKAQEEVTRQERSQQLLDTNRQTNALGSIAKDQEAANKGASTDAKEAAKEQKQSDKQDSVEARLNLKATTGEEKNAQGALKAQDRAIGDQIRSAEGQIGKDNPEAKRALQELQRKLNEHPDTQGRQQLEQALARFASTADNTTKALLKPIFDSIKNTESLASTVQQLRQEVEQQKQQIESLRVQGSQSSNSS